MAHDLFSSLDSFVSASVADAALMVRDVVGDYRLADAVLLAAQRLLAGRVRGADMLNSLQDSMNQVWQEMTRRNLNIRSTLTARPGLLMRAIVNRDLVLRPCQPLFFNMGAHP